jgi:flagellin
MRINHNISALNTYRQLSSNNTSTSKSLEKLSSGLAINRAGDNAAGLAISEKMRGQIRGLDQASSNANDGISLIQTAEGALNETQSILQRMRELAVQASNDTNTANDRAEIQKEIDQLTQEIDRIGNTTEFNTKKLLNGGASVTATVAPDDAADTGRVTVTGGSADTVVDGSVEILSAGTTLATSATDTTTSTFATAATALGAASATTINGVSFSFSATDTVQDVLDTVNDAGIGVTATFTDGAGITFTNDSVGSASELDFGTGTGAFAAGLADTTGSDAVVATTEGVSYVAVGNHVTITSAGDTKGLEFDLSGDGALAGDVTLTVTANGGLNMHIGANEDQTMYISVGDMRSQALGVNGIDVTTKAAAESSITTIQNALDDVSSERAKLGAYQNRLEHTINNLGTTSENLSASESRIRDVDMAKEMMEFTKNNILSQAAQAMLAQANQQPQSVLQLLQ